MFGCLTADGEIDTARTRALVAPARPLSATCHRAFDMVRDPAAALEALIDCGVDRVLTSGQRRTRWTGCRCCAGWWHGGRAHRDPRLRRADPRNIAAVRDAGLTELHFSAPRDVSSGMRSRNPDIGMGGDDLEREIADRHRQRPRARNHRRQR